MNIWVFLIATLVVRYLADTRGNQPLGLSREATIAELRLAVHQEPDVFVWHDLISDRYFQEGELRRSLFHRREAMSLFEQTERERDGLDFNQELSKDSASFSSQRVVPVG